jgi:hypothetical protein
MWQVRWTVCVVMALGACRVDPTTESGAPTQGTPSAPKPVIAQRPATVTDEHVRVFERMVAVVTELAPKLDAGGDDCNKLIATLKAAGNPAVAAELSTVQTITDEPAARDWFSNKYSARVDPAMASLTRVTRLCSSHPELESAVTGLGFRKRRAKQP